MRYQSAKKMSLSLGECSFMNKSISFKCGSSFCFLAFSLSFKCSFEFWLTFYSLIKFTFSFSFSFALSFAFYFCFAFPFYCFCPFCSFSWKFWFSISSKFSFCFAFSFSLALQFLFLFALTFALFLFCSFLIFFVFFGAVSAFTLSSSPSLSLRCLFWCPESFLLFENTLWHLLHSKWPSVSSVRLSKNQSTQQGLCWCSRFVSVREECVRNPFCTFRSLSSAQRTAQLEVGWSSFVPSERTQKYCLQINRSATQINKNTFAFDLNFNGKNK